MNAPIPQAGISVIDGLLTPEERNVLATYRRRTAYGLGRVVRLSIQYAVGLALVEWYSIHTGNAWWSLITYAVFLLFLLLRVLGARRIAGRMPAIIDKYEYRIRELESQTGATS